MKSNIALVLSILAVAVQAAPNDPPYPCDDIMKPGQLKMPEPVKRPPIEYGMCVQGNTGWQCQLRFHVAGRAFFTPCDRPCSVENAQCSYERATQITRSIADGVEG
ncbi:hypothetical protein PCL_12644 [Purpureocillium lilacinum]|uniref:Uncharacterized protein n=1 Tax=Purpureocillium lilacinum TaxID=33203 RepID=A0A2U3E9U9_PURLI|nr:hypothetical protein Purlil1_5156 [Purpureocillium lilacinum]PWI71276.1 hypothetical protein PCL_12644 [Purpureocillium lilacinum]